MQGMEFTGEVQAGCAVDVHQKCLRTWYPAFLMGCYKVQRRREWSERRAVMAISVSSSLCRVIPYAYLDSLAQLLGSACG